MIATEGQRGVGFFVIGEGDRRLHRARGTRSGARPGDYFGEVALIDDGPRTATVTRDDRVTAYGMTAWDFRPLVEENAEIAWKLLQAMAKLLRNATASAAQLSPARPGRRGPAPGRR